MGQWLKRMPLGEYDPPAVILERLAQLDKEIAQGRKKLEGMLQ